MSAASDAAECLARLARGSSQLTPPATSTTTLATTTVPGVGSGSRTRATRTTILKHPSASSTPTGPSTTTGACLVPHRTVPGFGRSATASVKRKCRVDFVDASPAEDAECSSVGSRDDVQQVVVQLEAAAAAIEYVLDLLCEDGSDDEDAGSSGAMDEDADRVPCASPALGLPAASAK